MFPFHSTYYNTIKKGRTSISFFIWKTLLFKHEMLRADRAQRLITRLGSRTDFLEIPTAHRATLFSVLDHVLEQTRTKVMPTLGLVVRLRRQTNTTGGFVVSQGGCVRKPDLGQRRSRRFGLLQLLGVLRCANPFGNGQGYQLWWCRWQGHSVS